MPEYTLPPKSEAEAVALITREGMQPIQSTTSDACPILFWPKSEKVQSLEHLQHHPRRKRATVALTDYHSFIAYLELHKEPGTLIFAQLTETSGRFVAVIDYHHANDKSSTSNGRPRWGEHRCALEMKHSPEWLRWLAVDGENLGQEGMALFLEDNRLDILEPLAADIIDIAKSISAESGSKFKSAIRLDNGDRKLLFETDTQARAGATGELTIPEKLKLRMPVFENGPAYEIEAFFRYRLEGGLKLRLDFIRPHKVVELALLEARNAIHTATQLPILAGQVGAMN